MRPHQIVTTLLAFASISGAVRAQETPAPAPQAQAQGSAPIASPGAGASSTAAASQGAPTPTNAASAELGSQTNPMVVAESVAAPLRKRMVVNYPPDAVDAKVSGRVKLQILVGKNGAVLATRVVEGPELLRNAARASVAHAEFSPMTLDGKPVYMATTLRLVFTLDDKTTPPTAKVGEFIAQDGQAADADALRTERPFTPTARIPGLSAKVPAENVIYNVSAAKLIHGERPNYPDALKREGVQGAVVLRGIIRKDGTVSDLVYVSGPEILSHSAIDAVQKWRYAPTLLGDQPVEVETTITVVFQLGNKPLP